MPFFVHEYKPKLALSNHCMHLPKLLKNACTQCQGSHLSRTSSLSSDDDDDGSDIYLDNEYAIIMEIRSRSMKAKLKPEEVLFPRKHVIMNDKEKGVKECEDDDDDDDNDYEEGSETFFSTRSCFSCCSSNEYNELPKRSILEEIPPLRWVAVRPVPSGGRASATAQLAFGLLAVA